MTSVWDSKPCIPLVLVMILLMKRHGKESSKIPIEVVAHKISKATTNKCHSKVYVLCACGHCLDCWGRSSKVGKCRPGDGWMPLEGILEPVLAKGSKIHAQGCFGNSYGYCISNNMSNPLRWLISLKMYHLWRLWGHKFVKRHKYCANI
jgi:hypothetical protein